METMKTSNFTRQSKFFISLLLTCQVLACELQPFSCHELANDIYSQTAKTVFSHLNGSVICRRCRLVQIVFLSGFSQSFRGAAQKLLS